MDKRLKLRHFQCFLEAAHARHLVDVAHELNITQAAVSKTLSELEDIVGAKLLVRERSGIKVTAQGELFFHYAAAGLASLEKGYAGLTSDPAAPQVEVRIGALPTVAARYLPPAIGQFLQSTTRKVRVAIQTGYNRQLLDQLHGGKTDLAIARIGSPDMMRELEFTHLYSEPLAMVARVDHPIFAFNDRARLAAIQQYPFLLPPEEVSIRPIVEQALIGLAIEKPATVLETVSNTFGRSFLRQSDAIWMISYGVVEDLLEQRALRLVIDPLENTSGPVGLIRRKDQEMEPALRHLSQILLAQTANRRGRAQGH